MRELVSLLVLMPVGTSAILGAGLRVWEVAIEIVGWWVALIFNLGRRAARFSPGCSAQRRGASPSSDA